MALTATSDSLGDTDNSDSTGNGSIGNNIRLVTLHKANVMFNGTLGFSIRGGREHTTGVFVSNVEPNSEAERSGLCIGDQIIRINGFPIEDATHSEVLQLIHSQSIISLKVRSVGMIPTKERDKGVTWKFVESKSNSNQNERFPILPLTLEVPPHGRLGCGICKGPVWKPGIFVQFTKDNCVARDAGLKRGDQILACNGVKFSPDVTFEHAVAVMKSGHRLELLVHRGVGMDLFPASSSGYNSSTSSLNGDNPDDPTLVQFKRLSIVKEESLGNGRTSSLEDVSARIEPRTNGVASLSSAISEEIKRRSERSSAPKELKLEPVKTKLEEDSSYHLKLQTLMKEVKEAHNKMFPGNHEDSPPSCPTPDYDTMSVTSHTNNNNNATSNNNTKVDMASFKSFTAAPVSNKPPPNYFPPPNGFQDEVSHVKSPGPGHSNNGPKSSLPPASAVKPPPLLTIREYPTSQETKVPSKFKFLSNSKPPGTCVRFGDELSHTVSQVLVEPPPSSAKKNSNVVTISIQHPATQSPFYLHGAKKGPAPQPPTKNKVTFNF